MDVQDLLRYTVEQKPIDFSNAFNSLVMDRVQAAVQQKKLEVASRLYGEPAAEEVPDTEE